MRCEACGHPLVRVIGEETITTTGGKTVLFRRQTDYLLCRNCLRLYSVVRLRRRMAGDSGGGPEELSDLGDLTGDGWRGSDDLDGPDFALEGGLGVQELAEFPDVFVEESPGDEPLPLEDEFDQ